jgi:archaellum component FlaG (FlaF/FlaG flagellin family)
MSQTIYFVAAVVAATALAGAMISISYAAAETMRNEGNAFAEQMQTGIQIINDPRIVPVHDGNITIYIKNIGKSTLSPLGLTLFLDGEVVSDATYPTLTNAYWAEGEIIEINMPGPTSGGDHTLKVILKNGVSTTMMFRT